MLVGAGVGDAPAEADSPAEAEAAGALTALLAMLAAQLTLPPPPRPEPLHWLTVTTRAEAIVPVAVQLIPTRLPPLAEPLHCVMAASVVVAGKGVQPVVRPSPEPTHWLTVTAAEPGLTPTKLFVIVALQLSVAPPPLADPLHWMTEVTGVVREVVVVVQAWPGLRRWDRPQSLDTRRP